MPLTIRDIMAREQLRTQSIGEVKAMARNVGRETEKPTPLKKKEPTEEIYRKGGHATPDEALRKDKSDVRSPVK